MGELFSLDNQIQNYAWGSYETLALMRGIPAPTEQPEAELWVGAHRLAPSTAHIDGGSFSLNVLVEQQPDRFLNSEREGDYFPFLFKVLAIESPLSIQVHPNSEQARAGFIEENNRGIALDDPNRNYKDQFSKPETVVALSPMCILTGVRDRRQLGALAEMLKLDWLRGVLAVAKTPRELLAATVRMPDDAAAAAVAQTVKSAAKWEKKHGQVPGGESAVAGAVELIRVINSEHPADRGLLVALVMNLLYLEPGDSVHTPAGQVHAYVSGTGLELMEPSDNVLRAGLTCKHVDVEELVKVLNDSQDLPVVQSPVAGANHQGLYSMWDSRLSVTHLSVRGEEHRFSVAGVAVALCVAGTVVVCGQEKTFTLTGTKAVMYVGESAELRFSGEGEIYIAVQR